MNSQPRIQTTTVGSYPVPEWLAALPGEQALHLGPSSKLARFALAAFTMTHLSIATLPSVAADRSTNPVAKHGFFAFDNGVGRGQWSPAEQARTLKELGYAGISYNETVDITNRLAAFRTEGLKIFALYVHGFLDQPVRYEPGLTNAIRRLKGSGTMIWLTIREIKGEHDAEAVKLVQEVADLAAESGVRVALYPHKGFYVATTEHALRVAERSGRTNVGVTINLCHEIMAGNADRLGSIVKVCGSRLFLVSINGANRGTTNDETIKVLGEGEVDVRGFLRTLDEAGYTGPIGLQCFNLKGDPRENLKRSMTVWREWFTVDRAEAGERK